MHLTPEQRAQLRDWSDTLDQFPPRDQEEVALAMAMALEARSQSEPSAIVEPAAEH